MSDKLDRPVLLLQKLSVLGLEKADLAELHATCASYDVVLCVPFWLE